MWPQSPSHLPGFRKDSGAGMCAKSSPGGAGESPCALIPSSCSQSKLLPVLYGCFFFSLDAFLNLNKQTNQSILLRLQGGIGLVGLTWYFLLSHLRPSLSTLQRKFLIFPYSCLATAQNFSSILKRRESIHSNSSS